MRDYDLPKQVNVTWFFHGRRGPEGACPTVVSASRINAFEFKASVFTGIFE